jgi:hypothetical protein
LRYQTRCALVEEGYAEGYVANQDRDAYVVSGTVRFVFAAQDSISSPTIEVPADAVVPAGQTVRVARVKMTFQPPPGAECRFSVQGLVRKP